MPELPELEIVREVLQRRVVGQKITEVELRPPGASIVIRDMTGRGFAAALVGQMLTVVRRRGKFLIFELGETQPPTSLVINPKLTGRLQLAHPTDKRLPKTHVLFTWSDGQQLRYLDQKVMGQLYLTERLEAVPDFVAQGPEALEIPLGEFQARLRRYRGEIKGVLTRGDFVAGIGNAYADEILWAARLHPFRKRTQLTAGEIEGLYSAMRTTLLEAIEKLRDLIGKDIHLEPREFMAVHMKTGEPCPRCGTPISLIGANQRITNFCRRCQPGGLIKGL
ncbi:MAG TPA: DNA-formamidopyrimidine glycosylase family protein [Anaerolineales bacterium]